MNLGDFFKNLKIDYWYKFVMVIGAVILVMSIFFEFKGITNQQGLLLGGSLLSLGLGEWSNHKTEYYERPPNAYTTVRVFSNTIWSPTIIGLGLDGLAIFLGLRFIQSF